MLTVTSERDACPTSDRRSQSPSPGPVQRSSGIRCTRSAKLLAADSKVVTTVVTDVSPLLSRSNPRRTRGDIERRRADELAELFLFEDVGTPTGGASAGEHRGHHLDGHLGEVEDH